MNDTTEETEQSSACCTLFFLNYRYDCDDFAARFRIPVPPACTPPPSHGCYSSLFYFLKVLIQGKCGICKGSSKESDDGAPGAADMSTQPCSQLAVFEFPVAKLQHVCREASALFPPRGWPRSDHTVCNQSVALKITKEKRGLKTREAEERKKL